MKILVLSSYFRVAEPDTAHWTPVDHFATVAVDVAVKGGRVFERVAAQSTRKIGLFEC